MSENSMGHSLNHNPNYNPAPNEAASLPTPRRRRPNLLLNGEPLPELNKGALALGFAHPIEPPHAVDSRVILAGKAIEVRFSAATIAARVGEIAAEISRNYGDSSRQLVLVGVLKGCSPFLTDLLRALDKRVLVEVDFVAASFYGNKLTPSQTANIRLPLADVEGKDILLVDDILDTGITLNRIISQLYQRRPRSIDACVLVEKKGHRCEPVPELRYIGFPIEGGWVVGYGMDYEQYYRNLPYVGILNLGAEQGRFE